MARRFEPAWQRRVEVVLETTRVPVVSRRDLIRLKRAAGRPQDLADVAALEDLERAEEDG